MRDILSRTSFNCLFDRFYWHLKRQISYLSESAWARMIVWKNPRGRAMHLRATPFLGPFGRLGKNGQEIPLGKQVSQRKKIGDLSTLESRHILWFPLTFLNYNEYAETRRTPGSVWRKCSIVYWTLRVSAHLTITPIRTLAKPVANSIKTQAKQHATFRDFCINVAQVC
jgi:hypothetical protein